MRHFRTLCLAGAAGLALLVAVVGSDAADALRVAEGPVLLDCVGTWLTAQLDELAGEIEREAQAQREAQVLEAQQRRELKQKMFGD